MRQKDGTNRGPPPMAQRRSGAQPVFVPSLQPSGLDFGRAVWLTLGF